MQVIWRAETGPKLGVLSDSLIYQMSHNHGPHNHTSNRFSEEPRVAISEHRVEGEPGTDLKLPIDKPEFLRLPYQGIVVGIPYRRPQGNLRCYQITW